MTRRFLRMLFVAVAATIAAGCGGKTESAPPDGRVAAPDMPLAFLDGSTARLSDLEGKVVMLNFWATWCPPCREELPHFEALHRDYADDGLAIVGVSMDQAGSDYVRKFAEEVGITYPIAMAPFEDVEPVWSKLSGISTVHGFGDEAPSLAGGTVQMMPTTFVIDRSGNIYRKHVGPRDRETLEPELRKLMGLGDAS